MDFNIKILAIVGKFGKMEAAKMIGVTQPTIYKKLNNPDSWKYGEIKRIEKVYEEHFSNSNPEPEKQS